MHKQNTTPEATRQECEACRGRGYTVEHWPADDGGPDYVLRPTCEACQGQEQIADPAQIIADMLSGKISPVIAESRLARAEGAELARRRAAEWKQFKAEWAGVWS